MFAKKIYNRFISKIHISKKGCWLWQAKVNKITGYGHTWYKGKDYLAHRFSYMLYKGKIPKKYVIDHLCRVRRCVNPNHLETVTLRENIMRGKGLASINARKTHCKRGHILSGKNLYLAKRKNRRTNRECKICRSRTSIEHQKKNK